MEDFTALIAITYVFGTITCIAEASDREIGWFWGLIVSVLFTPFIGIICIFATPSKTTVWIRKRQLEQNDIIIQLLSQKKE